jgi:hypothetical protein
MKALLSIELTWQYNYITETGVLRQFQLLTNDFDINPVSDRLIHFIMAAYSNYLPECKDPVICGHGSPLQGVWFSQ